MKAVLQAGWLLTVAVGNIIVLIVAEAATLPEQVGGFRLTIGRHVLSSLTLGAFILWDVNTYTTCMKLDVIAFDGTQ